MRQMIPNLRTEDAGNLNHTLPCSGNIRMHIVSALGGSIASTVPFQLSYLNLNRTYTKRRQTSGPHFDRD